jgi:hypothetical protein
MSFSLSGTPSGRTQSLVRRLALPRTMLFPPLCTGAAAGTGSHSGIRAVGARLVPAQIVDESCAALPLIPVGIEIVVILSSASNTRQGWELFQEIHKDHRGAEAVGKSGCQNKLR